MLKTEISREQHYDLQKQSQILKLKHRFLNNDHAGYKSSYQQDSLLFEEYRSFKYDSAFIYVNRMINLSGFYQSKSNVIKSTIALGTILLNSGMYKEAFDQLEKIDTNGMTTRLQSDYHIFRARLYHGIAEYDNDAVYSKVYLEKSESDFKNVQSAGPANHFEKVIDLAFNADPVKQKRLTADFFFNFLTHNNLTDHNLAMASTRVSFAFTGEDKIRFLTLAAINDIRSSTKETTAILMLGQELFKSGNSKDAYFCIQQAIKDAKFYGARGHQVQIEAILPIIAGKLLAEKQLERDKFLICFLLISFTAAALFLVLFIFHKQILRIKAHELVISRKNNELQEVNEKLWESSRIKEEFIGLFFKSCSTHIETIEKMKRKIQHNMKLENYQQVHILLNNVQIERERAKLNETLDTMFLTLFPNFISSFNMLLHEKDQLWPKAGETLNASLRIFALIRLGINELETIAKILNYSASTVYTYKVRIKSKALVPAEDFEKKIMEIKFTDGRYPG
ncbi:DUF6377 domain-containing protein [Pedobacter sp. L105]|uniref:DUF6377 domain-containing protein n=1 Tax=Pedobacter sp. L105 TaxID=1641871 RepID=UPI00131E459D|nr:DUF6377 domain-containing protein [Pedobacter sp. L105]